MDLKTDVGPQKSAFIVKFGQIGDVIMAIPSVHALHRQGFQIHWACGSTVHPLLSCYSWINPMVINDKAILFGRSFERLKSIVALWRSFGFKQYDLCVTLYYDRRYRMLTFPLRAKRQLALSQKSRATTLLPGRSHMNEYMRVLLGGEDTCHERSYSPVRPDRLPPSPWKTKVASRRVALVPSGASKLVRQQFSARSSDLTLRRWPIESYVAVARRLLDRDWEVVLLGGPDDAWVKPHFDHLSVTDSIGKLSLSEVISACDTCDAVISHDTGPLHLAGLSKASLVGIFGPTDPSTFLPRRPGVVGIWGGQGFACRPCYDGRDFAPCQFNGCMHQVTPELVLRELDRLLSDRSQGIPSPWRIVTPDQDRPSSDQALLPVLPSSPPQNNQP